LFVFSDVNIHIGRRRRSRFWPSLVPSLFGLPAARRRSRKTPRHVDALATAASITSPTPIAESAASPTPGTPAFAASGTPAFAASIPASAGSPTGIALRLVVCVSGQRVVGVLVAVIDDEVIVVFVVRVDAIFALSRAVAFVVVVCPEKIIHQLCVV